MTTTLPRLTTYRLLSIVHREKVREPLTPYNAALAISAVLAADKGVPSEITTFGAVPETAVTALVVTDEGKGILCYRNLTKAEIDDIHRLAREERG